MNIVSEEISDIVDHVVSVAFGDRKQRIVCLSMTLCMDGIEFHLYGIILSSAASNSIYIVSF